KFLVLATCCRNQETSLSKVFGEIKTEILSEHLVLIPFIGAIIHGLVLTYKLDENDYASIGTLDSFVSFMEGSPLYLEHIARW
ncbi:putative inner membrane protein, partial [Chlamydia psittaci 84-8471/1]